MLGVRRTRSYAAAAALLAAASLAVPVAADAHPGHAHGLPSGHASAAPATCPPSAAALGYSDALDKRVVDGVEIGGLSDIAYDARTHRYVSSVDNHADDPSRLWFYRDLADPTPVGDPLVLTQPDGTPYTGRTTDFEGLAVLPSGDFVVSDEVEPAIRIFSRDGRERTTLPVPPRFAVTPAGEATDNATLEGLTLADGGHEIVASMEGTLSGDTGDGTFRRILVYTKAGHGYRLSTQIGYRVEPGMRIPEIQEYAPHRFLVMEASWSAEVGNRIRLYAIDTRHAVDVSRVGDLADAPATVAAKRLVSDVTSCPDLGASAKETQLNPLMDNYEGMIATPAGRGAFDVTLVSDDNFGATQTTRFLRLAARLP